MAAAALQTVVDAEGETERVEGGMRGSTKRVTLPPIEGLFTVEHCLVFGQIKTFVVYYVHYFQCENKPLAGGKNHKGSEFDVDVMLLFAHQLTISPLSLGSNKSPITTSLVTSKAMQ